MVPIAKTAAEIDESTDRKWAGETGADVTANNPIEQLRENFENPLGDVLDRWVLEVYQPVCSVVSGEGVAGGNILRVGDNLDNDRANLVYYKMIPFDPSKLYRVRVRAMTTAGSGKLYFGITAYTAAGADNDPTGYTASWFAAEGESIPSAWTEYTGYVNGTSAAGSGSRASDPASPGTLKAGTAYFPVFVHVNYNTVGITDIDEIVIDAISEESSWSSVYEDGKPDDNADRLPATQEAGRGDLYDAEGVDELLFVGLLVSL